MRLQALVLGAAVALAASLGATTPAFALCQTIVGCAYIVNGYADGPVGAVSYQVPEDARGAITLTASKAPPPPQRVSDPEQIRKIFDELRETNRKQVALLEQLAQLRSQDPDYQRNRLLRLAVEEGMDIGLVDDGRVARELTGKQPPRPGPRVVPPAPTANSK